MLHNRRAVDSSRTRQRVKLKPEKVHNQGELISAGSFSSDGSERLRLRHRWPPSLRDRRWCSCRTRSTTVPQRCLAATNEGLCSLGLGTKPWHRPELPAQGAEEKKRPWRSAGAWPRGKSLSCRPRAWRWGRPGPGPRRAARRQSRTGTIYRGRIQPRIVEWSEWK